MLDTLAARLALATPSLSPTKVPDAAVTPGVWGFVVTAAIGVVVILLVLDMIRRLRRVNYRAEIRERIAAEEAATADGGAASGSTGPGSAAPGSPDAPVDR